MNGCTPQKTLLAQRQRGVSLFVVIIFVMLSMLLALWASRTALFSEMVVGNDADYQRAFEAAQALLQDAELDIRGTRSDGRACELGLASGTAAAICRRGGVRQLPLETQDVPALLTSLNGLAQKCANGLCVKRTGRQDFWNKLDNSGLIGGERHLSALAANNIGARYGQYTGAANVTGNLILADNKTTTPANKGGWYWIEILPYTNSKSGVIANAPANYLDLSGLAPNIVFRITAIAYGRKPNSMVVLQETYARPKIVD